MGELKITMFWEDKNWKGRGYANNVWLHIYPGKKTYKTYTSYGCDIGEKNVVEVVRKSDIKDMIEYLKAQGFTAIED